MLQNHFPKMLGPFEGLKKTLVPPHAHVYKGFSQPAQLDIIPFLAGQNEDMNLSSKRTE